MKNRIISLLLAIMMVAGMLPTVAFAAELCDHHPDHTADCGYVEGESECTYACIACAAAEDVMGTPPEDTASSEITGVSITVDGVTYTEGEVIVKSDSMITVTFLGTNLEQQNPDCFIDTTYFSMSLTDATPGPNGEFSCAAEPSYFEGAERYPITYTNDGWATEHHSGIFVTYEAAGTIRIEMSDDWGGWNGAAIEIHKDGALVETVALQTDTSGTAELEFDSTASYAFKWNAAVYDDECAFAIYVNDEKVFEVDGVDYEDGKTFLIYENGEAIEPDPSIDIPNSDGKILIDMDAAYGDGWDDSAIEIYKNGAWELTATVDAGTSAIAELEFDSTASYAFKWVADSYSYLCSFLIYADNEKVFEIDGVDYKNGHTFLIYENGEWTVLADLTLKIGNNIVSVGNTYTYTAEDKGVLQIGITGLYTPEGVLVDEENLAEYGKILINGTAISEFENSVEVSEGDTVTISLESEQGASFSGQVTLDMTVVPDSEGKIAVVMEESYGDAWNGAAIEIYKNGTLALTASIAERDIFTEIAELEFDSTASYEFKWVRGSYDSECSFAIYVDGDDVLQMSSVGTTYADGETILTYGSGGGTVPEEPAGIPLSIRENGMIGGSSYFYTAQQSGILQITVSDVYCDLGDDGNFLVTDKLNEEYVVYINDTPIDSLITEIEVSEGETVFFNMEPRTNGTFDAHVTLQWKAPASSVGYAIGLGENSIEDGPIYTYTAEQRGTLLITVSDVYCDQGSEGYYPEADALNDAYIVSINGSPVSDLENRVDVVEGDSVTVAMIARHNGRFTATATLEWESVTAITVTNQDGVVLNFNDTISEGDVLTAVVSGFNGEIGYSWRSRSKSGSSYQFLSTSESYTVSHKDFKHYPELVVIVILDGTGNTVELLYDDTTTEHSYTYGCDTNCAVCGELTRPEATHIYDNDSDANCNACGAVREVSGPAEITGVSITVDGVTYTEGNLTITPDTQSVIYTVTGTNFANLSGNNFLWYAGSNMAPLLDTYFVIDTVENTATLDLTSDLLSQLESCDNFEVLYSNDNLATLIGSGIYLTYDDGTSTEPEQPEDTTSAEITGVSITVDGETYTEGNVTIKPDSTISYTVTGTNFANLSESNWLKWAYGVGLPVTANNGWVVDTVNGTANCGFTNTLFADCDKFQVQYSNDGQSTWIDTGIYLTYDDGTSTEPEQPEDITPGEITGVSITVDGVTYSSGNVTIKPDSTISYTVTGTNFANLSESNVLYFANGYYVCVTTGYGWTVDTLNGTVTRDFTDNIHMFVHCDNYRVQYSNDGESSRVDTDIYLTYDDSTEDTTPAEITGVFITVDGVTYGVGNVTIKPDSTVSFTVTGTNFANLSESNVLNYAYGLSLTVTANSGWAVDTVNGRATRDFTNYIPEFEVCDNFQVRYSNDGQYTWNDTGIYLTYERPVPDSTGKIVLDMIDQYGDGWNNAAIEIYKNGELEQTATIESGFYNVAELDYDSTASYEFKWVKGDWDSECSFAIYVDGGESVMACEIGEASFENGETILTLAATSAPEIPELKITRQPTNGEAKLGERFCVEVLAQGEGLTYRWYFKNLNATRFSKSSVTDNTYDDVMTKARMGRQIYCVITDANGNSVTTETVTLIAVPGEELAIITQPNDAGAKLGEEFCVTVEAQGDDLQYRWYYRKAGTEQWKRSSVRDNTYNDVMTKARHNREVYCVITDAWGNSVTTDIATISGISNEELAIVTQPFDEEVPLGEMFNVFFEAKGDGLKYQWYFRKAGTEKWYRSAQRDNSYDDVMTTKRHNRELYCVVTDAWGNTVSTDPIVVIMAKPVHTLAITAQPENASAKLGEEFCVTVEAQGDELQYRWYYRKAGTEQWKRSGVRDNTYNDVMTAARHNREVYCVITDMWGNSVTTEIATITGTPSAQLAILQQPVSCEVGMGEMFNAEVLVQGDGLKYTWYFRKEGATKWSKSGVRDNTYDDVMNKSRAGREVYCVITDAWGNTVQTDVVTLIATN